MESPQRELDDGRRPARPATTAAAIPGRPHDRPRRPGILRAIAAGAALAALAASPLRVSADPGRPPQTSDPVGVTVLTVPGGPTVSYLSLNLVPLAVARGVLPATAALAPAAGTSGTTLVPLAAAPPVAAAQSGACYLELTSGAHAGFDAPVLGLRGGSLLVGANLGALLAADGPGPVSFCVRPCWTLASVFGADNRAGWRGGDTAAEADEIECVDAAGGQSHRCFYNPAAGQWQQESGGAAADLPLAPTAALRVWRKDSAPLSVSLTGAVKLGPTGIAVSGGGVPAAGPTTAGRGGGPARVSPAVAATTAAVVESVAANPYPLDSVPLVRSGLYTGDPATGVAAAADHRRADAVIIYPAAPSGGRPERFFFNSSHQRWETAGGLDASTRTVPAGGVVRIRRKHGRPAFVWYLPAPASASASNP